MLGQPISMLIPEVVGFKLTGKLREGVTATDLVLTVTEMLRAEGRGRQVRRVLRRRPRPPAAGRPRDHRQHGARIRRDLRLLPDRRRDPGLPALHRPRRRASRWSRPTPRRRACGATSRRPRPGLHRHAGARPGRRRAVASPAPSARRTAWRCRGGRLLQAGDELERSVRRRARRASASRSTAPTTISATATW